MDSLIQHISTLLPVAIGIVLGWFAHLLTSKRDRQAREHADKLARDARLRAYEVFLLEKEQLVEASDPKDLHREYFHPSGSLNAGLFRGEAAKVRRDFSDRDTFNSLDDALSRLTPQTLQGTPPNTSRDILASAIRALIQYVRNA